LWVLSCWVESFGFDDFVYVIMILFILHDLFCFRLAAAIYMHHADQSMNLLVGAAGSGKAKGVGVGRTTHHSTHIAATATRPPAARSAGGVLLLLLALDLLAAPTARTTREPANVTMEVLPTSPRAPNALWFV
jgi:hypothetical protein